MLPKAIKKMEKPRKRRRPKKGKIEEAQKFYLPGEKDKPAPEKK